MAADKLDQDIESNMLPAISESVHIEDLKGIAHLHKLDPKIKYIRDIVEANTDSPLVQEYIIEDGIIYHLADAIHLDYQPCMQFVIPSSLFELTLTNYHDANGHFWN